MGQRTAVALAMVIAIYLLIGTLVFMQLELDAQAEAEEAEQLAKLDENTHKKSIGQLERELKQKLEDILNINLTGDAWGELLALLQNETEKGALRPDEGEESGARGPVWDFVNSLFFSFILMTTIGYGDRVPTTPTGKIFAIFYGLFGVPIAAIGLAKMGDFFSYIMLRPYKKYKSSVSKNTQVALCICVFLFIVMGAIVFIMAPAAIFVHLEGWPYVDGVYYSFITLTTIGFGDLVAGNNDQGESSQNLYKLGLLVWIIFGLGYLSTILNFISKAMRKKTAKIHVRVKKAHKAVEEAVKSLNKTYADKLNQIKTRTESTPSLEVDDEEIQRQITQSVLTKLGFVINTATTDGDQSADDYTFELNEDDEEEPNQKPQKEEPDKLAKLAKQKATPSNAPNMVGRRTSLFYAVFRGQRRKSSATKIGPGNSSMMADMLNTFLLPFPGGGDEAGVKGEGEKVEGTKEDVKISVDEDNCDLRLNETVGSLSDGCDPVTEV